MTWGALCGPAGHSCKRGCETRPAVANFSAELVGVERDMDGDGPEDGAASGGEVVPYRESRGMSRGGNEVDERGTDV